MEARLVRDAIIQQPFFRDIKPQYLEILAGCAARMTFKKDHLFLRQGDPADHFYAITDHGQVALKTRIEGSQSVPIETLGPGEVLGWSWLIPPHKWHFDALAVEDTHVLAFDGVRLREKCDENCDFGYDMIKRVTEVVAKRLYYTRMQLMDHYVA